jgi:hypothetical protein
MPLVPVSQSKPSRLVPVESGTPKDPHAGRGKMDEGGSRDTFETRTTPRITQITDPNQNPLSQLWDDLRVAKVFMTSSNADEFVRGYNKIYPGSEAITDEVGNVFIVNSATGEMGQVNKPGADFTDVLKLGSEAAKYASVTQPQGFLGKMALAAGIATTNELLSEDFQVGEVALETALAPVGHFVGLFPNAVRRSNAAMMAFAGLKKQDQKLARSVENWLVTKADDIKVDVTPARARNAANQAYKDRISTLQKSAKPLYDRANKTPLTDVNLDGVSREYNSVLRKYGEGTGFRKAANKAMSVIKNAKTFEQLNGAKKELDRMMRPPAIGETGYTREERAIIKQMQQQLVKAMDRASPSYAQARSIYTEGLTEASAIAEGVVGRLARIKDAGLEDISRTLFNQNPRAVRQTAAILEKVEPGVMEDLAYMELRDRFNSIVRFSVDDIADNPSAIMKALIPSKKSMALLEALPDDTVRALRKFDSLMRKAESLKPDARRDVIGQGLWAPLGLPYRASRKASAMGGIYQQQAQAIAILEILTNRESLNSRAMKHFVSMPFTSEKQIMDGFRLLTQMSDEIGQLMQPPEPPRDPRVGTGKAR